MKRLDGLRVSVVAALALLGCADGNTGDGNAAGNTGFSGAGTGGAPTAAGTGVATAGASGAVAPPAGADAPPGPAGMGAAGMGTPAAGTDAPPAGGTGDPGVGGAGAGGEGGAPSATGTTCGRETMRSAAELGNTDMVGPFTPAHVESTGPNGSSWVYHPEELGEGGLKHPVMQWGPGAGTGPSNYLDHLNLLASQGFVIISQPSTQSGREALDWILAENEESGSMWYQKLDPDRVTRGGHSMGALQSFSESDDPRLKLAVLVCGGANGGSGASNMSYPTLFLGGDGEGGTINFAGDYAEVTGLSVFITHGSTDHIYCARDNLAPWVAFMRWQLCGEERWKQEFAPGGTYCQGDWLACMTKNF